MKLSLPLLLAGSLAWAVAEPLSDTLNRLGNGISITGAGISPPPEDAAADKPESEGDSDDNMLRIMEEKGLCFNYLEGGNLEKSIRPCKSWCKKKNGGEEGTYGCGDFIPEGTKHGKIFKDSDGREWVPAECKCECAICDELLGVVLEGFTIFDQIMCRMFSEVGGMIIEAGISAIPGGALASTAVKVAVRAAKTLEENAMGGASLGSWIGSGCGPAVKDWNFSIEDAFIPLTKAPDSVGKSGGCRRKDKKKCKRIDPRPDEPKGKPTGDKPKTTSALNEDKAKPATTTSTKPTSTRDPNDCTACGTRKSKINARDVRWGQIFSRKEPSCRVRRDDPDGRPVKKSLFKRAWAYARSWFEKRDNLTTKEVTLELNGKTLQINGKSLKLRMGRYLGGTKAENEPNIDKAFDLTNRNSCNDGTVSQMTVQDVKNQNDPSRYDPGLQTEHIFEAQTVAHFFEWLADAKVTLAGDHNKPSQAWVTDVLLNGASPAAFRVKSHDRNIPGTLATKDKGELLHEVIAIGFGRSDGTAGAKKKNRRPKAVAEKDLALIEGYINNGKGTWFNRGAPNIAKFIKKSEFDESRLAIREGAATFGFLAFNSNGINMWDKFMRVSNWIDHTMHIFDQQYAWGTQPGEPTRRGKHAGLQPSMRALWCQFIDDELKTIERKAKKWTEKAEKDWWNKFRKEPGADNFRDAAWDTNGFASVNKLKFPRPAVPAGVAMSVYGAWGNQAMTFDAAGNPLPTYIGSPPPN